MGRSLYLSLVALLALLLQISAFPHADLVLILLCSIVFFMDGKSAFLLSFPLAFFLDLFSPLFGISLLFLPPLIATASRIHVAYLNDRSPIAFLVLSLMGIGAFRILQAAAFSFVSLITRQELFNLSIHWFAVLIGGLAIDALLLLIVYGLCSRSWQKRLL